MKKNSENIGQMFTDEGLAKLSKGQILIFTNESEKVSYKITKINKKEHECWIIPVRTYLPDEVKIVDAKPWKNNVK